MTKSTYALTEYVQGTIKVYYDEVEYLFQSLEIKKDRDNYISDFTLENDLKEIKELREKLINSCQEYHEIDREDWERRNDYEIDIENLIWSLSAKIGGFIFSNLDGVY